MELCSSTSCGPKPRWHWECAPAHPFRLLAPSVQNARLPAQPRPKPVSSPCSTSTRILARAGIGEPIAAAAGEDAAAVEGRHAPPAADGRADEPGARTAEFARSVHDAHGILLILPLSVAATMPVDQDHAVSLGPQLDRGHGLTVARPLPSAPIARPQHIFPRPAPHVQSAVIVRCGLRAVAPAVPATRPAPWIFP